MTETRPTYLGEEATRPFHVLRDGEGFVAITHSLARTDKLTIYEKQTLIVLLSYAGSKTTAWPSHQTLAQSVGCSVPQIKRALASLEGKIGLGIQRTGRSNIYTIDLGKLSEFTQSLQNYPIEMSDQPDSPPGTIREFPGSYKEETGKKKQEEETLRRSNIPSFVEKPRSTKSLPSLSNAATQRLRDRFKDTWSVPDIDERISFILGHKAARKWADIEAGVLNWLKGDAERSNGNGTYRQYPAFTQRKDASNGGGSPKDIPRETSPFAKYRGASSTS